MQWLLQRARSLRIIGYFLFLLQRTATVACHSRFVAILNKPLDHSAFQPPYPPVSLNPKISTNVTTKRISHFQRTNFGMNCSMLRWTSPSDKEKKLDKTTNGTFYRLLNWYLMLLNIITYFNVCKLFGHLIAFCKRCTNFVSSSQLFNFKTCYVSLGTYLPICSC